MPMTEQEQIVTRFTTLLGTKASQKDTSTSSLINPDQGASAFRDLTSCLSKVAESHEVICTIPSLDMRKVEDDLGGVPLPKVGEHRHTELLQMMSEADDKALPQMAASVLGTAADASASAAQVEQKAAQSLGSLTSWTKSSVAYAASAISTNVSDSFSSLVDSRVRAWTLLLLRHSLTSGDSTSRSRLLSMLSSIIKVHTAKTSFKTIPLPETAAAQPKEADVILPLLLEVEMEVSIQGNADKVTLRAPGTVAGNFDGDRKGGNGLGLVKVDIALDTGAMLDSMVQQARMIVFKAVAKATSAAEGPSVDTKPGAVDTISEDDPVPATSQPLAGFSSALNMTSGSAGSSVEPGPHQPGHRLQKARSSALKLNSVLQGTPAMPNSNAAFEKTRKMRSVQWDNRMDVLKVKPSGLPSPKKQRVADASARLRSFKSFGRPHAGDFGSGPRNATFGDFGRKPIWGRDGKLANRPSPINPNDLSNDMLSGVEEVKSSRNATFDFQRPSIHLSSGLDLGMSKSKKTSGSLASAIPGGSGLTRSATAYENWLLAKTSGGKR